MRARQPVLMVGIDASNEALIDDLVAQGRLPALSALLGAGARGSLESCAELYAGGVWPSFYTGRDVPWHGIYHNKLWRADAMRCEVPTDAWLGARPFWESWQGRGSRACIVDVPMILGKPRPLDGVYLGGGGTHDLIAAGSWPASLWGELARQHGAPLMPREQFGRQTAASLLRLRDALLRGVAQTATVMCDLLNRERWDFSCVVFGGVHRIGHYLTDLTQVDEDMPAGQRDILERALDEMYEATEQCDRRACSSARARTRGSSSLWSTAWAPTRMGGPGAGHRAGDGVGILGPRGVARVALRDPAARAHAPGAAARRPRSAPRIPWCRSGPCGCSTGSGCTIFRCDGRCRRSARQFVAANGMASWTRRTNCARCSRWKRCARGLRDADSGTSTASLRSAPW